MATTPQTDPLTELENTLVNLLTNSPDDKTISEMVSMLSHTCKDEASIKAALLRLVNHDGRIELTPDWKIRVTRK